MNRPMPGNGSVFGRPHGDRGGGIAAGLRLPYRAPTASLDAHLPSCQHGHNRLSGRARIATGAPQSPHVRAAVGVCTYSARGPN